MFGFGRPYRHPPTTVIGHNPQQHPRPTHDHTSMAHASFGDIMAQAYKSAQAAAPYSGGMGPLSASDEEEALSGVLYYLNLGANINAIARHPGQTALDMALEIQNEKLMALLLDKGATIVPPHGRSDVFAKEFVNTALLKMFYNPNLWMLSQATTERLIAMAKAWMDTLDITSQDYTDTLTRIRNHVRGQERYAGARQLPSWMLEAWRALIPPEWNF